MRRMIGLLMMVGLMVGVVGCGDDDNPVKSDQELLVGTWVNHQWDDWSITFRSDGTYHEDEPGGDEDDVDGTWSLVGDQLTYGSETTTIVSVTDTELTITYVEDGEPETWVLTRQT